MRLLIVSHPPLSPEYGAAQLVLRLAAALRARGHDVIAWSPEPLPQDTLWWQRWRRQRREIDRFVAGQEPFDVIDLPAVSVGPGFLRAARRAAIVARNVQPELLYLASELGTQLRRRPLPSPRLPLHAAYGAVVAGAIVQGWRRAHCILCLGSLELEWMRRRFPRWTPKLRDYRVAPSAAEQAAFAEVRRGRRATPGGGARFLWIGRWSPHKGTGRLVRFLCERAAASPADTFTIAGCGPEAARDCPPQLLASGRLRIIPGFRRDELPGLLATHDAGLFTSAVEGWGLSLNEMLESGMPVFATPAGGVPDLAPFWEGRLRPFPPPPGPLPQEEREPELEAYFARFSWDGIAARYEEDMLRAVREARTA